MAKKAPKTLETLKAELDAAVAAAHAAHEAWQAPWTAYREAWNAAKAAGLPLPSEPDRTELGKASRTAWDRRKVALAAYTRAKHAADPTYVRAEKTLRVTTPYGTFERTTPRPYTHLVVMRETEAYLRRVLERDIASEEKYLAEYVAKLPLCDANGIYVETMRSAYDGTSWTVDHNYREYVERAQKRLVELRERLAHLSGPTGWGYYRWSSTLRNALGGLREIQRIFGAGGYEAHVIEVATGTEVA